MLISLLLIPFGGVPSCKYIPFELSMNIINKHERLKTKKIADRLKGNLLFKFSTLSFQSKSKIK